MPIYEYRCDNDHTFEVMQRMSDDALTACQVCEAPVKKVLHPVAVHFKGSGFYTTDYGKRKGAAGGDSKKDEGGESSSSSSGEGASSGSGEGSSSGSGEGSSSSDKGSSGSDKGSKQDSKPAGAAAKSG